MINNKNFVDYLKNVKDITVDEFKDLRLTERNMLWVAFKNYSGKDKLGRIYNENTQSIVRGILSESSKGFNQFISDWYKETYPTDELGNDIRPSVTFIELLMNVNNVYDILNVDDSLVRERVFEKLADLANVDYDVIYNKWLN